MEKRKWPLTWLLPYWSKDKNGHHFADNIFKSIFLYENCCNSTQISWVYFSYGSINNNRALVQRYRQQAIIWTNDGIVYWHVYASSAKSWHIVAWAIFIWLFQMHSLKRKFCILIQISPNFVDRPFEGQSALFDLICKTPQKNVHIRKLLLLYMLNSFPPSATYMRQWMGSALLQIMARRLFGAKPLSEPMLSYCQLDSWEHISVKFELEFDHFHARKCIWTCHLPIWRPFCPGADESTLSLLMIWCCQAPECLQT